MPHKQKKRTHRTTTRNDNGAPWATCGCLIAIAATLVLSLFVAMRLLDVGYPLPIAALHGAACGVVLVWMSIVIPFGMRRMIWHRTRGYPFLSGDVVEITSGPNRGRLAWIRAHDQGVWYFQIEFKDENEKPQMSWISAGRLRKIHGNCEPK